MEAKRKSISFLRLDKVKVSQYFYKYALYVVFILLLMILSQVNPNFLTVNNMINLLLQTSTVGIAAAGLTFVLITRGIDISMGSVIYLTSIVAAKATNAGVGLAGAFLIAMSCGAVLGMVNGFFITKLKMPPLIVTLAMLYVIRGLVLSVIGVPTVNFRNDVSTFIVRTQLFDTIPLIVLIMIFVFVVCQIVLSRSTFGRNLYAIGNNRRGAEMMGINATRHIFLSYVICGALVGLSGLLGGAQIIGIPPTFARGQEFIIISSAVLGGVSLFGGKGSAFPGAFLGVLIIMTIENGLVMAQANVYAYTIVRGIIIFFAVFLDSLQNRGEIR